MSQDSNRHHHRGPVHLLPLGFFTAGPSMKPVVKLPRSFKLKLSPPFYSHPVGPCRVQAGRKPLLSCTRARGLYLTVLFRSG